MQQGVLSVADRLAIREVVDLYFHGIDARDSDVLGDCFTDDVYFTLTLTKPLRLHGRSEVVDTIQRAVPRVSNHSFSNIRIWSDAGLVRSITHCVAIIGASEEPGSEIHTRGIRYDDEWQCIVASADPVWKIRTRHHHVAWQYISPAAAVTRWVAEPQKR